MCIRDSKLTELAAELQKSHGVTVRTIAADLGKMEEVQRVYDVCLSEKIAVEYLVNNAGFGDFHNFADSKWEAIEGMIDLNVKALTKFCLLYTSRSIGINRKFSCGISPFVHPVSYTHLDVYKRQS